MAKRRGSSGVPGSRMAKLRARRLEQGQKQVTVFLSAEAAKLLDQMGAYAKKGQSQLIAEALEHLACSYSYWNVDRPASQWWDDDEAFFAAWDWAPSTEAGSRGEKPVPPWFVERERLAAAEAAAEEKKFGKIYDGDGLEVYRRGVGRNKLR